MSIYKLIITALSGLIFIVLMRRLKDEYALFLSVFINVTLMLCGVLLIQPVLEYAKNLEQLFANGNNFITVLLKCSGIALITSFAAEICSDFGESSLASKTIFIGKCGMLCYSLPLIKRVYEYAFTFVS